MGQQHNKLIKRNRRKRYLKRRKELEKTEGIIKKKKVAKPATAVKAQEPVKKAAKKVAKKAPETAEVKA